MVTTPIKIAKRLTIQTADIATDTTLSVLSIGIAIALISNLVSKMVLLIILI